MENLDIYILTSIVASLFGVFIIGIYRTLRDADKNPDKIEKEGGPRVALFNIMAKLFEDETIPEKEKKKVYRVITETLADMESDGIRFPDSDRVELDVQIEKSL